MAWFSKEIESIFHNEWMCVARNEELQNKGDFKIIDLLGESIIILRDRDLNLKAFTNLCKHRGCQLLDTKEALSGNIGSNIRCPYHSWTYNLQGELIKAPYLDINLNDKKYHLNDIRLETWAGCIFLSLNADTPPLKNHLSGRVEQFSRYPLNDLISKSHSSYEVNANWKIILENYNECYHCAGVHPELCNIVPAFRKNGGADLQWEEGVPQKKGTNTFTFSGTTNRKPFPGLNEFEKERHFGQAIYPNLLISFSMDHVAIFIIHPLSEVKTIIDFHILFHPQAINNADFHPDDAFEFWDLTNKQDWKICERVQRGMQSKTFTKGFYGKMEDENLDVKQYITEKLNLND